mmetsp:Transcript_13337/g.53510  ORF Transcript_13337/g.53510 Transcript_13337/m.53510 type:complete len:295 (-) Transcript_13337:110-994(-)
MFRERSGLPASLVQTFGQSFVAQGGGAATTASGAVSGVVSGSVGPMFSTTTAVAAVGSSTTTPPQTTTTTTTGPPQTSSSKQHHPASPAAPAAASSVYQPSTTSLYETSPIFLQFLDAIWQILRQFPTVAEFDDRLVEFLWRQSSSRWFASFLRDSERQRATHAGPDEDAGVGVWRYVERARAAKFENVLYDARTADRSDPLVPNASLRALGLCPMYLPADAVPRTAPVLRRALRRALRDTNNRRGRRRTPPRGGATTEASRRPPRTAQADATSSQVVGPRRIAVEDASSTLPS